MTHSLPGKKRGQSDAKEDMRPSSEHLLPPDDADSVKPHSPMGWRQVQLLRAGFTPPLAASIARERTMDLHALIELVERGCPPELAARILAPLDDARTPC